jgi:FKBP-type peptidyl-prolyl cis-trans isomerase SlpA
MDNSPIFVTSDAHLTLHYRISLADGGGDVVSTFGGPPATLQMGLGQLAEPLEQCLLGLAQGAHASFDLAPDAAFGARNPALVQRLSRAVLAEHAEAGTTWEVGDLVDFPAPDGGRYAGVLKEIDERSALFDFNHPLAGHRVCLEVRIIAVL